MLLVNAQMTAAKKRKACRLLCLRDVILYSRRVLEHPHIADCVADWQRLVDIQRSLEGSSTTLDVAAMFKQAEVRSLSPLCLFSCLCLMYVLFGVNKGGQPKTYEAVHSSIKSKGSFHCQ